MSRFHIDKLYKVNKKQLIKSKLSNIHDKTISGVIRTSTLELYIIYIYILYSINMNVLEWKRKLCKTSMNKRSMEKYNSNEYCCLGGCEVMRTGGHSL